VNGIHCFGNEDREPVAPEAKWQSKIANIVVERNAKSKCMAIPSPQGPYAGQLWWGAPRRQVGGAVVATGPHGAARGCWSDN